METLRSFSNEEHSKYLKRQGALDPLFGVEQSVLDALRRKLKANQSLAKSLWASANHDAMALAALIAEPNRFDFAELDRWARGVKGVAAAAAFGPMAAQTSCALEAVRVWGASRDEFVCRCGYQTLASMLERNSTISPQELKRQLSEIERRIDAAPNRAREGMNIAVIAIGVHREDMRKDALATAARIGPVRVEFGKTERRDRDAVTEITQAGKNGKKKA